MLLGQCFIVGALLSHSHLPLGGKASSSERAGLLVAVSPLQELITLDYREHCFLSSCFLP